MRDEVAVAVTEKSVSPSSVIIVGEVIPPNEAGLGLPPFTVTVKSDDVAEPPAVLSTSKETASVLEANRRGTKSPIVIEVDATAWLELPVAKIVSVPDAESGT